MSRETCGTREKCRDLSDKARSLRNHGYLRKEFAKRSDSCTSVVTKGVAMTTKKKSLHVEKSRLEIDISQMVADHLDVPDVLSTNQIRLITEAIMHDLAPLIRAGASMRTYVGPPRCDEDMAVAWDTAAQHLKECP